LNIGLQGVTQLRSGLRELDPAKDSPPNAHFIVSVARGPEVSKVRPLTELCGLRVSVESYMAPKGPLQCKRCQCFGHTQRTCGYTPRCFVCAGSHISGGCSTPREQPQCCGCGRKPHSQLPWLCEVEGSEGGSCKASARTQPKERRHRPTFRS
jgi:hypothetical protein